MGRRASGPTPAFALRDFWTIARIALSRLRPNILPLALTSLFWPAPAHAGDVYLEELVTRAREHQLADRVEWRKLLHYKSGLLTPGVRSLVDSRGFFNAPNGKTDPQAELEATLASFFSEVDETPERQHPQCAFIARYAWLQEALGFDPKRLPPRRCKRFEEWHAALNPQGITLVFPAAYINNPSSMYGHTLLRIDGKDQNERTRLLAYAINFTANTRETNGILFAVNGLIGTYPGQFSIMPYYLKVREYSDLENRDIWEYELDLSPVETDRVLKHAWELGSQYFDYYFFDENCAYHLLALLETARPDLELTGGFRWWAIPSETIIAVEQQGLVRRAVYRPSNATTIQFRLAALNDAERRQVSELTAGQLTRDDAGLAAQPPERQAALLELANDYVNYLRATRKMESKVGAARSRELMLARSRLEVAPEDAQPPIPIRPDQGHRDSRVALGAGRRDGRNYAQIRLRPAYHDLMDPEEGYGRGAQIQFFDLALRKYEDGAFLLEEFVPIDILSLAPRNDFFTPLSWKVNTGWTRQRQPDGDEPLMFGVNGGVGAVHSAPDTFKGKALLYAFLEGTVRINGQLDDDYAVGAGLNAGGLIDLSSRLRLNVYARADRFFAGQEDTPWKAGLQARLSLSPQSALRFDFTRQRQSEQTWNDALLSLLLYF